MVVSKKIVLLSLILIYTPVRSSTVKSAPGGASDIALTLSILNLDQINVVEINTIIETYWFILPHA
jgi:hypothetical protein